MEVECSTFDCVGCIRYDTLRHGWRAISSLASA